MRKALIKVNGIPAANFIEATPGHAYHVEYLPDYQGAPISLTMPITTRSFSYDHFPPFFDGLLPEGPQLEGLLRIAKIDRKDYFSQLIYVGNDTVGAVTVEEVLL
jgi:serine/threonine-protein kinase HipA